MRTRMTLKIIAFIFMDSFFHGFRRDEKRERLDMVTYSTFRNRFYFSGHSLIELHGSSSCPYEGEIDLYGTPCGEG